MSILSRPASARATSRIAASALLLVIPVTATSQLPGVPVLQNAFPNPGFTAAVNYGEVGTSLVWALAGAWSPSSGNYQVSVGGGTFSPVRGVRGTNFGGRFAMPVRYFGEGRALGLAAFAGAGGAVADSLDVLVVPAGLALGYRVALGDRHSLSLHVAPMYRWERNEVEDESSNSAGLFRAGVGIDVGFAGRFGLTLGWELGQEASDDQPGPRGSVFGAALSYAFR